MGFCRAFFLSSSDRLSRYIKFRNAPRLNMQPLAEHFGSQSSKLRKFILMDYSVYFSWMTCRRYF